jgi:hypothetical protein
VAPLFVERETSPLDVRAKRAPLLAIAMETQSEAPTFPAADHNAPLDADW